MSGIGGVIRSNGAPIDHDSLARMTAHLSRRGPERAGIAGKNGVGLVHTLLATTPESSRESQPLTHRASGCIITADARLDNRHELAAFLDLEGDARSASDAEYVLAAYLKWGTRCVDRLMGDFAFAIWNPSRRQLFCARDRFGVRPFYYYHCPVKGVFAFASEARALLQIPLVPMEVSEHRVADFLVPELEGVDETSSFFRGIFRLPPAHSLVLGTSTLTVARYWELLPGSPTVHASDDEYADAFLELFADAVQHRLRTHLPVGSMLSGGLDSGSVVAVARKLLIAAGTQHLHTFSGTSPLGADCVETRTIRRCLHMSHLCAHEINYGRLPDLLPALTDAALNLDEPFDGTMTLPRAMYAAAQRAGVNVVLDGVAGDLLLSPASYLPRLLRSGHWMRAYREAHGADNFWGDGVDAWSILYRSGRAAIAAPGLRRLRRQFSFRRSARANHAAAGSAIGDSLAERVHLDDRLRRLDAWSKTGLRSSYGMDCAVIMANPYLTVARERYDRAASLFAVEPRDPFLDVRLVSFCLGLPGSQRQRDGWPKFILRHAMRGLLSVEVRQRRGKEHLGSAFTAMVVQSSPERFRAAVADNRELLRPYVRDELFTDASLSAFQSGDLAASERLYEVAVLGSWLRSLT